MKITCDNCGAKYSIADEKVRGKVFKIRCKKCSHIVVVRGTTASEEPVGVDRTGDPATEAGVAAAPQAEAADGAKWHVVVGREQVGPCSVENVRERFAQGEISAESYIWREGFADWMRLAAVEEFSDLVRPASADGGLDAAMTVAESQDHAAAPLAASAAEPAEAGFDASAGAPGFAAADGLATGEPAGPLDSGGPAERDYHGSGGGDAAESAAPSALDSLSGGNNGQSAGLFGGSAPSADHKPMFGDEDDDDDDLAHPQMTGQRGENSVLFSLANLQALAIGGGAGATAPSAGSAAGVGPDAPEASAGASSEGGSGLIDIRAMAAASAAATSDQAVEDDLPAMTGFGGPVAAAPVLLPSASSDRPAWLLPTVIGLGVLFLAAVGLLLALLYRTPEAPAPGAKQQVADKGNTQAQPGSAAASAAGVSPVVEGDVKQQVAARGQPAAVAADAKTNPAGEPAAGDEPSTAAGAGEPDQVAAPERADKQPTQTKATRSRKVRRRSPRRRTRPAAPAASAKPAARPRAQKPKDELDRLLENSMGGGSRNKRRSSGAASSADSNLPPRLSRSQIVRGMSGVKGRVQSCYDRYKVPGLADVRLKIANTGKVKSARVRGLFAGTPTGSCVQNAVKSARFPRFKVASMSITYPFMLR